MNWVAWKMLSGDRAKHLGLVFGITFATLLMSQQVSIFMGILKRTGSQILDVRDAEIWVMDEKVRYEDEIPALPETELHRVRGVPGVEWAVRLHRGTVRARLSDGNTRNVVLLGVDDATFVAAPQRMILGSLDDLRRPDAVIVDKAGYEYMWPGEAPRLGHEFQINDRRAVLVGICEASPPFTTMPILYTRFNEAVEFAPRARHQLSVVLAAAAPGVSAEEVCRRITAQTGRLALTRDQFFWKTIRYFLGSTGIPINFGITIALGFIVGGAITGQTFYLFTIENLKQFGALKAMGVTNVQLMGMILLQGAAVGATGYGLGLGLTALFFAATSRTTHLAGLHLTWPAMIGVGAAIAVIIALTSLASIRKVLVLEPGIVFK